MADDDELLDDDGEASEGGGSEAPLIEEDPPVKCEECAPCKGGAPAWMATFADMATLLMAFFVLILSFAEMNVPKYKQITGSLKAPFGVQRLIPIVEPPKARSMIAREFSPAEAKPTPQQTVKQDTTDTMKREVELQTETKTEDFKNNADFQAIEKILAQEIAEGQVEVKVEDEKIVVELVSPASSGGEGEDDNGSKSAGIVDQKTVEMFAKVAEAQSQIESEIVVKDTTADQSKAGEREGDVAQSGTSGESTGGPGEKQNLDEQLAKIRMELSEDIEKGLAEVEREGDKIIVRLAEQGSFRSGFADIQPGFQPLLNRVGNALSATEGPVTVEGHTDNVPIAFSDRFQSNWDLSAARSAAVADYLLGNTEIQQGRLTVVGYADTKPLESNDTAEGRSKNRRIEIIVNGG
ncbi:MAG: flagellar motor protein MotB [Litorivicinaceae bacterium]